MTTIAQGPAAHRLADVYTSGILTKIQGRTILVRLQPGPDTRFSPVDPAVADSSDSLDVATAAAAKFAAQTLDVGIDRPLAAGERLPPDLTNELVAAERHSGVLEKPPK